MVFPSLRAGERIHDKPSKLKGEQERRGWEAEQLLDNASSRLSVPIGRVGRCLLVRVDPHLRTSFAQTSTVDSYNRITSTLAVPVISWADPNLLWLCLTLAGLDDCPSV